MASIKQASENKLKEMKEKRQTASSILINQEAPSNHKETNRTSNAPQDKKVEEHKEGNVNKEDVESLQSSKPKMIKKGDKVENTHSRATFLVENGLLESLNEIAKNDDTFTKKAFIDFAIRLALEELENEKNNK